MERLPSELCSRVFFLLDHRALAAALQVCRAWKRMASEDALWSRLFADRWGAASAQFYAPPLDGAKSWKDVYEVQDRCDRIGMSLKIVREGRDYYLVYQGQIQRLLGTRSADGGEAVAEGGADGPPGSPPALSEKMLFFLGDLEAACALARRTRDRT
ncbi:unnamed protein product [Spirodela intermedia]|uniref:F-box protein n=1 Tax=Spirodela intermedia TaxID=51605 RepID=A0A7I8K6C2_SPIIN|nr:unnamed protein product [Spirodela intermedia]